MNKVKTIGKLQAFRALPLWQIALYSYCRENSKLPIFYCTYRHGKKRVITPWRLWHLTTETLRSAIVSCFPCREQYKSNAEKNMTERPRKRKLQTLPKAIFELIDACCERGHSLV